MSHSVVGRREGRSPSHWSNLNGKAPPILTTGGKADSNPDHIFSLRPKSRRVSAVILLNTHKPQDVEDAENCAESKTEPVRNSDNACVYRALLLSFESPNILNFPQCDYYHSKPGSIPARKAICL